MAKKKKKKKKKSWQDQTRTQLLQTGLSHLSGGNPQDAISVLKFAEKRHGKADDISDLLFRCYITQAGDLFQKGMKNEADAMRNHAWSYLKAPEHLSETDLLKYLSISSDREAFHLYKQYLSANPSSPAAEQRLAWHLFQTNNWELADAPGADSPLARDAVFMREAMPMMKNADWEMAAEVLRGLPRKSPFASIRLFCRAMASFYSNKDEDAVRALNLIPKDFPLKRIVRKLKTALSEPDGSNKKTRAMARLSDLWDGPVNSEGLIRDILDALTKGSLKQAANAIREFAGEICQQDQAAAIAMVLQTIQSSADTGKFREDGYVSLVRKTLPPDLADSFIARVNLTNPGALFSSAGEYITRFLNKEFPDAEERRIAKAMVLLNTAHMVNKFGREAVIDDRSGLEKFRDVLGVECRHDSGIAIDLAAGAIRLDPQNKAAYMAIAGFPRNSKEERKKVETSLLAMRDEFPDDPYPCLELASLYYETHAFRKAEAILGEAMKRAPHDNRVVDRHAISLLVSAEINIRRGKFHLVDKDIKRAEDLESRKLAPYIKEKKLLAKLVRSQGDFQIGKKGQIPLFEGCIDLKSLMDEELGAMSLFEGIRLLSLLMLDIGGPNIRGRKSLSKFLEGLLKDRLKQDSRLSSQEIAGILTPPPTEFRPVFPDRRVAPLILKMSKNILGRIKTEEIIPLYDLILEPDVADAVLKDIRKRIKNASEKDRLLLEFYMTVIQILEGEIKDPGMLEEIVGRAGDGPVREELRAMARRLSVHAPGRLKTALENFNFSIFQNPFPMGNPFFDLDFLDSFDDDDDFDDDEFDDDDFDPVSMMDGLDPAEFMNMFMSGSERGDHDIDAIVGKLEDMVDELGLRGAPEAQILSFHDILTNEQAGLGAGMNFFTTMLEMIGVRNKLSREAFMLFYGKKKNGKGSRSC